LLVGVFPQGGIDLLKSSLPGVYALKREDEGPLSAVDILALLETFMPRRSGARGISVNRVTGKKTRRESASKTKSN